MKPALRSKEKDEVISMIFQIWIYYFGSPTQILSDYGGEFNKNDFLIMGEKLNQLVFGKNLLNHLSHQRLSERLAAMHSANSSNLNPPKRLREHLVKTDLKGLLQA